MHQLIKDFRAFVLRGNVLDLAVAVVIGVAFNAVVTSLVNDVIMQVVAAIFGEPNFDSLTFALGDGVIHYGRFLTALVNFLIVAATLFVVVRSFEQLQRRRRRRQAKTSPTKRRPTRCCCSARSATCCGSVSDTRSTRTPG